jgi:hypothetical protein
VRNRPNDRNSYASRGARAVALIGSHPRESVSVFMGTAALGAIVINALFMQPGPHPAPIWSSKAPPPLEAPRSVALPQPRPVEAPVTAAPPLASTTARSRADIISDIQRELLQRGFYDGAVDGRWGGKTDAAAHEFVGVSGLKLPVEATEDLLRAIQRSNRKGTTGRAVTEAPAAPAHTDAIGELLVPKTQQAAASPKIAAIQRAL